MFTSPRENSKHSKYYRVIKKNRKTLEITLHSRKRSEKINFFHITTLDAARLF